jgi:acetyltransferase
MDYACSSWSSPLVKDVVLLSLHPLPQPVERQIYDRRCIEREHLTQEQPSHNRDAEGPKKYGMRIMGPNCLGFVRPVLNFNTTFLRGNPPPGNIAFISQSGALGSAILDWAVSAGIGFSMFVSLGSMIDVDFGDMIDFLGDDEATRSILIYMEGVGNARKFMSAARAFARRKPIIILKPGRFAESAKAAHSHTGAMAGDDAVYEAVFRRAGVVRAGEIAELFDAAEVLDSNRLPAGARLAIVTVAGGPGVMATDALIHLGGELARLSGRSRAGQVPGQTPWVQTRGDTYRDSPRKGS